MIISNTLSFRKYRETDEIQIQNLTEPSYYKKFKEFSKETVSIALESGTIVGWFHLDMPDSSLYSGFVFIYVAPAYRRKGIGTLLYREAERQLKPLGCSWWSSYPESEAADKFALSVGFDYTNTNSYLVHPGTPVPASTEGIRGCRTTDFPAALDLWSKEYADMHIRIGLPFERKQETPEERKEAFNEFCRTIDDHFVLELDQKIIGCGAVFHDASGIGAIAVDRAYAGKGYGTRLAAFLTNECIRRGCKTPHLYCEAGNDDAMHIYRKIGYVEQSRESVAVKN